MQKTAVAQQDRVIETQHTSTAVEEEQVTSSHVHQRE